MVVLSSSLRRSRRAPRARSAAVLVVVAALGVPAAARAESSGGARYVPPSVDGGAGVGVAIGPLDERPIAALLKVAPRRLRAGRLPVVRFRVRQRGVADVAVRVRVYRAAGRHTARRLKLDLSLGLVRVGHTRTVAWPRGSALPAGRYVVSLHAADPTGRTLARRPPRIGQATLTVVAPPEPKRAPAPAPAPTPTPTPAPTPAPAPTTSGVFPVAGPYGFGGDDARFGSGRKGHVHQGQDVLAAAGTSVVAPEPGTIIAVDFQRGGAGFYVTEQGISGRAFFFAHFQKGSTAVVLGQPVAAGTPLGRVGATGDASGPHLHFEIWEGGWPAGHPIDPLPQLRAWAGTGAGAASRAGTRATR
jgi:murein DD-endopeptidase MepM/ murein hydrolase activator NlpD